MRYRRGSKQRKRGKKKKDTSRIDTYKWAGLKETSYQLPILCHQQLTNESEIGQMRENVCVVESREEKKKKNGRWNMS